MKKPNNKKSNENEIFTITGENGQTIDFILIAEVELNDYSYLILKPCDDSMGLDPDEAIIFRMEADGGLEPEWDDDIIDQISEIYNNDLNNK